MELFRQEYEARLPRNWGAYTYERLKVRANGESGGLKEGPPRTERVRDLLERPEYLDVEGPIDLTPLLGELPEDELCDFILRFPSCKSLILRDWNEMSDKVLRCLSITMGPTLEEVDLSGSAVTAAHLEILLARVLNLQVLVLNRCHRVDPACMSIVTKIASKTLRSLYLDESRTIRVDPLLILAGLVGFHPPKLSRLMTLSFSCCPLEDKGLQAVALCCKHLSELNLNECSALTDIGVLSIITVSPKLKVLNLYMVSSITDRSIIAVGHHCPQLSSLNIGRCSRVTDMGITALARGCVRLQAANFAGLRSLSESALWALAESCKGLLMLNITGCEAVTVNGLNALIMGMHYVEAAGSFVGFKPIDDHVEKKLTGHLVGMRTESAIRLQRMVKSVKRKRDIIEEFRCEMVNKSASVIQMAMRRYCKRLYFYYMWRDKTKRTRSVLHYLS